MRSFCGLVIALLLVSCANEVGGNVASVTLAPSNVLLVGEGDTWPLRVTVLDEAGVELMREVVWEVDDPSVATVDVDGVVTAATPVGSTYVRAVVDGVTSEPTLVYPAEPRSGVRLITDVELAGDVQPVLPEGDEPVSRFRVEFAEDAELPVVDSLILSREDAPLVGRVASVTGRTVEVVSAPLPEIVESLDLSVERALRPDGGDAPGRVTEPLTFMVGEVACEAMGSTDVQANLTRTELDLSGARGVGRLTVVGGEVVAADLLIRGNLSALLEAEVRMPDPVSVELTCEYGFPAVPIPLFGPFSEFLAPFFEPGVGLKLTSEVSGAELGYRATVQITTDEPATIGVTYRPDRSQPFQVERDWQLSSESRVEPILPQVSNTSATLSYYAYGFVNFNVGVPIEPSLSFGYATVRGGLRHTVGFRPVAEDQLEDATRSSYRSDYIYQLAAGNYVAWWLDRLGIPADFQELETPPIPLGVSPTGTLRLSEASVAAGEPVTATVTLDSALYGLLPNVSRVALYHQPPVTSGSLWSRIATFEDPDATQTVFDFEWTPGDGEVGQHTFAAMVETVLLPGVWLEVADDSRRTLTVEGDSQPFDVIELSDPMFNTYRFYDVNDAGQLSGYVGQTGVLITPRPPGSAGESPVWWVDTDSDGFNDLAVDVNGRPDGAGILNDGRPRHLNEAGTLAGGYWGDGRPEYPGLWSDPSVVPENILRDVIREHMQNTLFPQFGISFVMSGDARHVAALNENGEMLVNLINHGASCVVQGTNVQYLGGPPTCPGCVVGRTNVGVVVYGASGFGRDMNDAGTVVGVALDDAMGIQRAAAWTPGGMPGFLGDLGSAEASTLQELGPMAINSAGQVVGTMRTSGGGPRHPVLWMGNTAMDLGTLGGDEGEAVDIDDSGAIIGWALNSSGERRPFLYLTSTRWGVAAGMHDLGDLVMGTLLDGETPIRMNNNGLILTSAGRLLRPRGA